MQNIKLIQFALKKMSIEQNPILKKRWTNLQIINWLF